jgi:hypothetical protein
MDDREKNKPVEGNFCTRTLNFEIREDSGDEPEISGYFAVFDDVYETFWGDSEQIDRHAFDVCLTGEHDIRCLYNHNRSIVLGREKPGTLSVKVDDHGLFGRVLINKDDTDAMNVRARVMRQDISQCSIGFTVKRVKRIDLGGGKNRWILKEIELHEVSVCAFPAYEKTHVDARNADDGQTLEGRKERLHRLLAASRAQNK